MALVNLTSEGRQWGASLLAFALVAGLAATDVALDLAQGTPAGHVLTETVVLFLALAGATLTSRRLLALTRSANAARENAARLAGRLRATEAEAARWRQEAHDLLQGLGVAIDRQLDRWDLSAAEKEVALLLLKGLSHKEIAEVRSVTDATARQQARAIYRKGGLAGRSDLAAFFLEDLMVPTVGHDTK